MVSWMSWRRMRSAIRIVATVGACGLLASLAGASPLREQALREAALRAGLEPPDDIQVEVDTAMAGIGETLFASALLSLNGDTSCRTCHLDEFASADGLPNAVGTGGHGEGRERLRKGGDIVPRNTLALWGRGSKGFDTFFWDGKVLKAEDGVVSQFGASVPSDDPLLVAVHLPFVEIREMVVRDEAVRETLERETVGAADAIYAILTERVRTDAEIGPALAAAAGIEPDALEFRHVAMAVAAFIRDEFAVRDTAFHDFVFGEGRLSREELAGGLIFYGKGRCSACHSGPLLSDLDFHAMPFLQAGFGKNGFGVDYGRFNVTRDPDDLYRFRTPPLINVTRTGPWTHSGAIADLALMVRLHVDPLAGYDATWRSERQRREDLARLMAWSRHGIVPEPLSDQEIEEVVAFLGALETGVN